VKNITPLHKALKQAEHSLIKAGRELHPDIVYSKQKMLAMKNIENALTEILKAQKRLKYKEIL